MLGQLNVFGKTKLDVTLDRIKSFEPEEGYYLAFSGGKDSQCIYELAKMAGVKFDAHYSVTSVDPPELVKFIKEQYPDVSIEKPRDKNGKQITMWNLIASQTMPPIRTARYCCEKLKESSGKGRVTLTGVRWAESANRKYNQGLVTVVDKSKNLRKELEDIGANFQETKKKGLVMNMDNSETRRSVEMCYRTRKTLVNPIIDWDESEVWEFLNDVAKVPHCKLYEEGFGRLGCIGCPLSGQKHMKRDFKRYPKYEKLYLHAFDRMIKSHDGIRGWKTAEEVMDWWLGLDSRKKQKEVNP